MLLRKIRSSLETQTLRNSFETQILRSSLETQIQIYAKKKKKKSSIQAEEKIETYTIPNCLYTSKTTGKGRGEKLGNEVGQQGTIWGNSRHS